MKISQLQDNREIIVKLLREKIVQYKMELEKHYILSQKARKVAKILYHIHSASIVNQNSKLLIIVSKILKKNIFRYLIKSVVPIKRVWPHRKMLPNGIF